MAWDLSAYTKYSYKTTFTTDSGVTSSSRTVAGVNYGNGSAVPPTGTSIFLPEAFNYLWAISDATITKRALVTDRDYEYSE